MELTKEYFDQSLKAAVAPLATKEDVRDGVEELARIVSRGFEDIQRRLDVTEQVKEHERKLHLIGDALHIRF